MLNLKKVIITFLKDERKEMNYKLSRQSQRENVESQRQHDVHIKPVKDGNFSRNSHKESLGYCISYNRNFYYFSFARNNEIIFIKALLGNE